MTEFSVNFRGAAKTKIQFLIEQGFEVYGLYLGKKIENSETQIVSVSVMGRVLWAENLQDLARGIEKQVKEIDVTPKPEAPLLELENNANENA